MNAQVLPKSISRKPKRRPPKILIPLTPQSDTESLLKFAKLMAVADPVLLLGIVPMKEEENLSAGANAARDLRGLIQKHADRVMISARSRVRVSCTPWNDIREVLERFSSIELLVLEWPDQLKMFNLTAHELLTCPPCDMAFVRGPFPDRPSRVLVPMRGGPHAERAFRTAVKLAAPLEADVTSLLAHSRARSGSEQREFAGLAKVVAEMPNVQHKTVISDNGADTILQASKDVDIVILGTTAQPTQSAHSFGRIPDLLLNESPAAVVAVKTKQGYPRKLEASTIGTRAISVLVDQWFAENTFHADEFSDLERLVALKEERNLTVSLALPTLNEEKTVGNIIKIAKRQLMQDFPLVDELVLIDSCSTDKTREIAEGLGVPVYIHQEILPDYGPRKGKGEALWKSLYVTSGDIIIWVDTDVSNFDARFIYGLIGPLLYRSEIMLVKGFYRRPLKTGTGLKGGHGGRVTELSARPLINLFYPELSGIIQPLSGEYGGRREVLEQLAFTSGYGVETCVLIDTFEKFKLASIAQVDMIERVHRNQPLTALSKMSFAIIQTVFSRLEKRYGHAMLEDVNRTMKLIKHEADQFYLEVEEIAELERPPMIEIAEYRTLHGIEEAEVKVANVGHDRVSTLYPAPPPSTRSLRETSAPDGQLLR